MRRFGVLIYPDSSGNPYRRQFLLEDLMHRWTGRWLLLLALMGNFVPVALAVGAAPAPNACCVRKAAPAHPCHGMASAPPSEHLTLHGMGCCGNDCRRASTTARWAHPQSQALVCVRQVVLRSVGLPRSILPVTQYSSLQSARAPPAC